MQLRIRGRKGATGELAHAAEVAQHDACTEACPPYALRIGSAYHIIFNLRIFSHRFDHFETFVQDYFIAKEGPLIFQLRTSPYFPRNDPIIYFNTRLTHRLSRLRQSSVRFFHLGFRTRSPNGMCLAFRSFQTLRLICPGSSFWSYGHLDQSHRSLHWQNCSSKSLETVS